MDLNGSRCAHTIRASGNVANSASMWTACDGILSDQTPGARDCSICSTDPLVRVGARHVGLEQPVGVRGVGHERLPQVRLEVLVLHENTLGRTVGLVPVHHRDVRRFESFGEHVEFGLLLQAPRIGAKRVGCRGRHRVLGFPRQQRPPPRILVEQIARQRGAGARKAQDDQRTLDPFIADLGVALDVVDDAKPIPQRVDELAVDEVASAWIHTGRGLARLDQQLETIAPANRRRSRRGRRARRRR